VSKGGLDPNMFLSEPSLSPYQPQVKPQAVPSQILSDLYLGVTST